MRTDRKIYLFDNPTEIPDRTPPERILLVRFGKNKLTKGDERLELDFSEKDADLIMEDFSERGKELVIDYEHQTEIKGEKAPAAGWIDRLEKGTDGLYANIKFWTPTAKEHLEKREYLYMSPVLIMSRRNKSIHSVALTNKPALHSFPALVADDSGAPELENDEIFQQQEQEREMKHLQAIAAGLGIQAEGKDEQALVDAIQGGVKALNDKQAEMVKKVEGMVSLSDLEAVKQDLRKAQAENVVAKANLGEELKDHAIKLAMTDMDAFNALVEISRKRQAPQGTVDATVASADANVKLALCDTAQEKKKKHSEEDVKIFKKMGYTDKQIEEME